MPKGIKGKRIRKSSALRINRNRNDTARALDATRKSKKMKKVPTTTWSKNPGSSDVEGIDDGSKLARQRNAGPIKRYFGKIGLKGARVANAQNANADLLRRTEMLKSYTHALENETDPAEIKELKWHINYLKKAMVKNQQTIARKNDY
jgi:hypothetical protein